MPRSKNAQRTTPVNRNVDVRVGTAKKSVNRINFDDLQSDFESVPTPMLIASQSSEASAQRPPTPRAVPKPPASKSIHQPVASNSKKKDRRKSLPKNTSKGNQVFKSSKVNKVVTKSRFSEHCIPKAAFQRILKGITLDLKPGFRMKPETLNTLQTAAEHFLVGYFEDAALCASHAKRKTVMSKDMELVQRLRKIEYKEL